MILEQLSLETRQEKMNITINELKELSKSDYEIIDIRDEIEISHGAIPGAIALRPEEIATSEKVDISKKLVICCSRGKNSVEVAEHLREKGYDARSLEGGYSAWLLDYFQEQEQNADEEFAKNVELSLRKTYKKRI